MTTYTDSQLDALRELANIASGTAATSLSQMLGREVGLSVPRAITLGLAEAVDAVGKPATTVTAVVIPLEGDIPGAVLLLIDETGATVLCDLLGVEHGSALGESALCEIGNILAAAYLGALGAMTGHELLPGPPYAATDLLGAVVASMLAQTTGRDDSALLLDSELDVAGEPCAISFMLLSDVEGIQQLLLALSLTPDGA